MYIWQLLSLGINRQSIEYRFGPATFIERDRGLVLALLLEALAFLFLAKKIPTSRCMGLK